jgi:hypothetical protein
MSLMVHYCDGFKSKKQINRVAPVFLLLVFSTYFTCKLGASI